MALHIQNALNSPSLANGRSKLRLLTCHLRQNIHFITPPCVNSVFVYTRLKHKHLLLQPPLWMQHSELLLEEGGFFFPRGKFWIESDASMHVYFHISLLCRLLFVCLSLRVSDGKWTRHQKNNVRTFAWVKIGKGFSFANSESMSIHSFTRRIFCQLWFSVTRPENTYTFSACVGLLFILVFLFFFCSDCGLRGKRWAAMPELTDGNSLAVPLNSVFCCDVWTHSAASNLFNS